MTTPTDSIFKTIIAPMQLEDAVLAVISDWLPTYLAETERQNGLSAGDIETPKFFGASIEEDTFPGERLPAILVVAAGTTETPIAREEMAWAAWWQIDTHAVVQSFDEPKARRMAGVYAAALLALLVQRSGLGGLTERVLWTGTEIMGMPGTQRNRSQAVAIVHFSILVPNMATALAGPAPDELPPTDPTQPYAPWVTVESAETEIVGGE